MEFHENAFQKKPPKTLLTSLVNCNEWSLIQNMLVIHGEEHLHMYVLSGQGDLEFINKTLPLNARTPAIIISSVRMQEYWREKMEKISPYAYYVVRRRSSISIYLDGLFHLCLSHWWVGFMSCHELTCTSKVLVPKYLWVPESLRSFPILYNNTSKYMDLQLILNFKPHAMKCKRNCGLGSLTSHFGCGEIVHGADSFLHLQFLCI